MRLALLPWLQAFPRPHQLLLGPHGPMLKVLAV
jgi:hypothetical protein